MLAPSMGHESDTRRRRTFSPSFFRLLTGKDGRIYQGQEAIVKDKALTKDKVDAPHISADPQGQDDGKA